MTLIPEQALAPDSVPALVPATAGTRKHNFFLSEIKCISEEKKLLNQKGYSF
jgi:hypothetical protein